MIENNQEKELIPHAHTLNCTDWRTCDCPPIFCPICNHALSMHGDRGCNHFHDQYNYLEVGCTCSVIVTRN